MQLLPGKNKIDESQKKWFQGTVKEIAMLRRLQNDRERIYKGKVNVTENKKVNKYKLHRNRLNV